MAQASKTVLFGGKKKRTTDNISKVQAAQRLDNRDSASRTREAEDVRELQKGKRKKKKARKRIRTFAVIVVLLAVLYCVAIFSNIPFIKKWRDIYIQTAMDTFNHKWLATYFIPESVIKSAMSERDAILDKQLNYHSAWASPAPGTATATGLPQDSETAPLTSDEFLKIYKELEKTSFNTYMSQNKDLLSSGYSHLIIDHAGLKDKGTTIKTAQGDQVLAVDAENGIIIVKVKGDGYVGKLAIIKDPSRVSVGVAKKIGKEGQTVGQIAEGNNAVLAINASGFADYQASGNGGVVTGLLISGGKKYNGNAGKPFMNIGFGMDNRLYIDVSTKDMLFRDAVEFFPALVINGDNVIKGKDVSSGVAAFGIQPRTALGQTADGTVLFLTIDGRKIGYSNGCTVDECANILLRYGAYQATNLDGGSSTLMVFRGQVITDPATSTSDGRAVPNAIIVSYAAGASVAESHIASGHGGYAVGGGTTGSSSGSGSSTATSGSGKTSPSPSGSAKPSGSASPGGSSSPGGSASPSGSAKPSGSPSPSGSAKPSGSPDASGSPSPSSSTKPSSSPSPSGSPSPGVSPSQTPAPLPSPSPSPSIGPLPSITPLPGASTTP